MTFSKNTKLSLLVMGISVLLTLLLAEAALRWLKIPQLSYGDNLPLIYEPDEELGFRFIPNAEGVYKRYFEWEIPIKINSRGWRDYEYPLAKQPGVYRIAVIGDSFTANLEVPLEKTYVKVLERLLRTNVSAKIEVLNFGVDGTGTDYHYKVFRNISLKYHPDMVIHAFFYNDITDVQVGKFYRSIYRNRLLQYQTEDELAWGKQRIDQMYYTRWGAIKNAILRHSFLARVVMYPFGVRWPHFYLLTTYSSKAPQEPAQYLAAPANFPNYGRAIDKTNQLIRQFKQLSDEQGVRYLLMFLYDKSTIKAPANHVYKLFEETIKTNNIICLDLFDNLRRESQSQQLFWRYDNHLTPTGCRVVAENLYRFLLDNKLLPDSL